MQTTGIGHVKCPKQGRLNYRILHRDMLCDPVMFVGTRRSLFPILPPHSVMANEFQGFRVGFKAVSPGGYDERIRGGICFLFPVASLNAPCILVGPNCHTHEGEVA